MFLSALKRFPFHFVLLLLFFLLHGYSEYVGLVPFTGMLVFFIAGVLSGAALFFVLKKILRSATKAGIVTTLVFLFYLFYGYFKDSLQAGFLSALSHHTTLLPLMLAIIVISAYFLRKSSSGFTKLTLFINCLLLVYLLIDAATIIVVAARPQPLPVAHVDARYNKCHTCARPDIYLIIMDEYSGNYNLQNYFHYNNEAFATSLRQKGFYVADSSSSNYSSTPVSVASTLSMDYLPEFHRTLYAGDYTLAEKVVDQSMALKFLQHQGYRFINHSIFSLAGQPDQFTADALPLRMRLITHKTLWNRVRNDLAWQLEAQAKLRVPWITGLFQEDHKGGNQRLINLTQQAAASRSAEPRFIYTHVMMPHSPYSFDSTGRETGINFYTQNLSAQQQQSAYVQYLAYTNKTMLRMVDTILSRTGGQAVIVLMSDHGFRGKTGKQSCASVNNNFMSVYLPQRNYNLFYEDISNVNVFRSLFNTLFHQQFARLPDKCIF